jgi:hypothetical protein
MLELVIGFRRHATLKDKTGTDELVEGGGRFGNAVRCHR